MKSAYYLFFLAFTLVFLSSCSTSYTPYAYDDIYYSPSTDSERAIQKNPSQELNQADDLYSTNSYENKKQEQDYNSNTSSTSYYPEEQATNSNSEITNVLINNLNDSSEVEYYNEDYAESLKSINSPVRSINSYDPYQRDRVIYTQDPFFSSPTYYGNNINTFGNSFVPSTGLGVGWNSYSGWNTGINVGFGYGYSPYGYGNSFCGNSYSPYYGYNPYSPFGNQGFRNPYSNGYNNGYSQGFRNGFNDGFYNNNNFQCNSPLIRTNTPRGNSGSPTVRSNNQPRPTRGGQRDNSSETNGTKSGVPSITNNRPTRNLNQRVMSIIQPTSVIPNNPTIETPSPQIFESSKPTNSYSPSNLIERPTRTNNPYSRPTQVAPQQQNRQQTQPQKSKPQQQTRPTNTYERSRPTYNRSTPSYSPPTRSSGGGGNTQSRPTQRRR